jgi:hypothetical protein
MKRILFLFVVLTCPTSAFLQDCDSTMWAQPGTYDVVIDSMAVESTGSLAGPIMLSSENLCLIESSRKPYAIAYIHIGAYLVTIYPKNKIADNTIEE